MRLLGNMPGLKSYLGFQVLQLNLQQLLPSSFQCGVPPLVKLLLFLTRKLPLHH